MQRPQRGLAGRRRITLPIPLDLSSVIASGTGSPQAQGASSLSPKIGRASDSEFLTEFEVGRVLGSGTSSIVKLVTHKSTGKQFASKCVRCKDEEVQQFARDEFELLRRLRHPSIVRAYQLYEEPGCSYICLEYCSGGSMQDYISQHGAMECNRAVRHFFQILHGINYLHQRRVIHRDVKPDNLIFANMEAKIVKISDFNSATSLGPQGAGTRVMLSHRGTHLYSAPELRFGRLWNERIDIWSSGLSFFFMLHGELPFKEAHETNDQLKAGRLPEVHWGPIPFPVKLFVEQCFAVRCQDRPPALELLLHPIFRLFNSELELPAGEIFVNLSTCGLLALGFAGTAAKIVCCSPSAKLRSSPVESPLRSKADSGDEWQKEPELISPAKRLARLVASPTSAGFIIFDDACGMAQEEGEAISASWPLSRRKRPDSSSPTKPVFGELPPGGVDVGLASYSPLLARTEAATLLDHDVENLKDYSKERSLRLLRRLAESKFERTMVPHASRRPRRPSSWCIEGGGVADDGDGDA